MRNINFCLFFLCIFLSDTDSLLAQDHSAFKKDHIVIRSDTLPFRMLLPLNYSKTTAYPLVLFLHGSGERGNDNEAQLKHGASTFLNQKIRTKYPAIVVFPQCAAGGYWHNVESQTTDEGRVFEFASQADDNVHQQLLSKLMEYLVKNYSVDQGRIYVGGLSMGAMGTFELVRRHPESIAAAFAICGGANTAIAEQICETPWWIFHGADDPVVPPQESRKIYDALLQAGAEVKLTLYPGVQHESWTNAFQEPGLFPWLFGQQLKK